MTALFDLLPALRARVAHASLGELPTPLHDASRALADVTGGGELWLKRDDLASPVYGGNKLRLLEHLLAEAREHGATRVYATGAAGSSFVLATALHAPRLGLEAGAICFPQPLTAEAERSQRLVQARAELVEIPHWSLLPLAGERVRRRDEQQGVRAQVLSQVRLSPDALLGYVSAGLELALQVSRGEAPAPERIALPIGSAATSAGILAGLTLAERLGVWRARPRLELVRIAAFPLSRRARVLRLASRALARVAELVGDTKLGDAPTLEVTLVTDQLGRGYPFPTAAGMAARAAFAAAGFPILDDTYSAKAAAHVLPSVRGAAGPVLLWCTKSSAPLPEP